jgi:hypothetical protein
MTSKALTPFCMGYGQTISKPFCEINNQWNGPGKEYQEPGSSSPSLDNRWL